MKQNKTDADSGASLSDAGLAGDLVTLTMTNLTRTQSKGIVVEIFGNVVWRKGKAYPARDIECTISKQPANGQS